MARKLDLAQLRQAKSNQFIPNVVKEEEKVVAPVEKKVKTVKSPKPRAVKIETVAPAAKKNPKKAGRPIDHDKKPTRATSIRIHPDLVEIPKILAGVSRKNVFTIYNEMIVETLVKYKKKYPQLLDDLVIPPKGEL